MCGKPYSALSVTLRTFHSHTWGQFAGVMHGVMTSAISTAELHVVPHALTMSYNQLSYDWLYTFNRVPNGVTWVDLCDELATLFNEGSILYCAAQEESAPSTGRRHYHVFVQFPDRVKPGRLCSLLGRQWERVKPHFDRRRGTPEEASAYCTKDESRTDGPLTLGDLQPDRSGQGRRRDLEQVVEAIRQGSDERGIAEEFPTTFIRNHRGAR